jgi:hypothetical protein
LVRTAPGFYRCSTVPVRTNEECSRFVPYLSAEVCFVGWRKYRRALSLGHQSPPINPQAIEDTRRERAEIRGLTTYIMTARGKVWEP